MPAYNFQRQFVPMIQDKTKKHTVRKRRKRQTKPGDWLKLYTGQRTKACELIYENECTAVQPIRINPDERLVFIGGVRLTFDVMEQFAKSDGFKNVYDFLDFFRRYPPEVLENELEVIYWR